jgi:gas vesicle protein
VNELASRFGKGITFIDIDETIFQTKALIYVMKDGKIIKKLSNQEFNTYKLQDGESFDFREFRDAELFKKTSIPIPKVVERIKRMFKNIDNRDSRVVLLTARSDFDDKDVFLSTFAKVGIPINQIYVERAGNLSGGTVSELKKKIILKYIKDGDYRRVRLIDDDIKNLKDFLSLKNTIDPKIIDKVKNKHGITGPESIDPIEFYALQVVNSEGKLKRIEESIEVNLVDVLTVMDIINECHMIHHLNESVMDSVKSVSNRIRAIFTKNTDIIQPSDFEKGLLSYLKDIGIGGTQMLYHAFNVYYNKDQKSREKIRELALSVKKEHIIDILLKLDVLTLHMITGPLHIIEAVTGWGIFHRIKNKIEPLEKKAKEAIHSLEMLKTELDGKMRDQVQRYTNALRRVFGVDGYQKIKEETITGDIAEPDIKIGCDPVRRRDNKKKNRRKFENFLTGDETNKKS